jgi:hypothetical protein
VGTLIYAPVLLKIGLLMLVSALALPVLLVGGASNAFADYDLSQTLDDPVITVFDQVGGSVALDGDRTLIGAGGDTSFRRNAGQAHLLAASDMGFIVPPPEQEFLYGYPYQRNVMIDFSWDPGAWPADANVAGKKELSPNAETAWYAGYDDHLLYDLDWFSFMANFEQYWTNSIDDPQTQGFIGIDRHENAELSFDVHLNNDPTPYARKSVYVEWESQENDPNCGANLELSSSSEIDFYSIDAIPLPPSLPNVLDRVLNTAFFRIEPSPSEEILTWTFNCESGESWPADAIHLIDYVHIATEAVTLAGDVNHDGSLNVSDVVLMLNSIVGNIPPLEGVCEDANNDGNFNIIDVVAAMNMIVGNTPIIPCVE